MDMLFNGVMLTEELIQITEVRRQPIPEKNIRTVDITGKHGQVFQGYTYAPRTIEVDFFMQGDYLPDEYNPTSELQLKVMTLSLYTQTKAPAEIIFSDMGDKKIYGLVESIDIENVLRYNTGTMVIQCFNPFWYATSPKTYTVGENGLIEIINWGTAPCSDVTISSTLKGATKFLSFVTPSGVIMLGNPLDTGIEKKNKRVYYTNCRDTVGFVNGSQSLLPVSIHPEGTVKYITDNVPIINSGDAVMPQSVPEAGEYGTKEFHGGFYTYSLPTDKKCNNFKSYSRFSFKSYKTNDDTIYVDNKGCLMVLLYDENDQILGRVTIEDRWDKHELNEIVWTLGGFEVARIRPKIPSTAYKTYTKTFTDESQLENITGSIISTITKQTYKVDVKKTTYIRQKAHGNSKAIAKVYSGWTLDYISSSGNYYRVKYQTQTGYVAKSDVELVNDGSKYTVTYKEPVYAKNVGEWNDLYGEFIFTRTRYKTKGWAWTIELHRLDTETRQRTKSWTKTLYDPDGTKYTPNGGKIAKIGYYFGNRFEDADPVNSIKLFVSYLDTLDGTEAKGLDIIGEAGDTFTVDCENQKVYKNQEEVLDLLSIDSDFIEIPAFTSSEMKVLADCDTTTNVTITEKFI